MIKRFLVLVKELIKELIKELMIIIEKSVIKIF